jgi:polyferredoxin
MGKVGYPKGLIKYSTQNGVANGWTTAQMIRRALRPRVLVYTGILAIICVAVGVSLYLRVPLKVDVIRDRGALAREVEQGYIENVFRLQIMNATESQQRYAIRVEGLANLKLASEPEVDVLPTEVRSLAVRVQLPPGAAPSGSHPMKFSVQSVSDPAHHVEEKAVFLVPR